MYPIIALWCHPRSMSTAIERIMRERGDLDCYHEPFMYFYYVEQSVREMPHFTADPDHPARYQNVRDMLLRKAERGPVFLKDMSYYVMPRMLNDSDFARCVQHSFLIRDPMAAILSYHKLDPEVSRGEIGLEAQWRQFQWLTELCGKTPLVLQAESVQADTMGIISAWWTELGLSPIDSAFSWYSDHQPKDWEQVSGWHQDVSGSSGDGWNSNGSSLIGQNMRRNSPTI